MNSPTTWQQCPHAVLVVDETYRTATYPTAVPDSVAGLAANIVVTSSLSKLHGTPGLRIGWAITPDPHLRDQLVHAKYATTIACSAVDEALAQRVLTDPSLAQRQRLHLAAARDITADWIHTQPDIDWVEPDGGGLCCIRLNPDTISPATLASFHTALQQHNGRVAMGAWFGDNDHTMRLGFGALTHEALRRALETVTKALQESRHQPLPLSTPTTSSPGSTPAPSPNPNGPTKPT